MNDKNEPWFVLNEICKILGYANEAKTRERLDEDECKCLKYRGSVLNTEALEINNLRELWGANDFSNKWLINESGLYSLIMGSRKPEAKEFKKWVTSEVLPMIRKTGMYLTDDTKDKLNNSTDEAIKELIAKYDEVKEELKAIQPAKQFYNNMVDTNGGMLIRDFAKSLNIPNGENYILKVYKWFRDNKFTMKNNLPYELQRRKGLMTVKLGKDKYGRLTKSALITELGVKYYHDLIVNNFNWIKKN